MVRHKEINFMEFTIDRNDLLDGLNVVSKAVSTRVAQPILSCILVTAQCDGIRLTANNLELGIQTSTIDAKVAQEGKGVFESKLFMEIIKKLGDYDVTISMSTKGQTTIKCGKSEFKIMSTDSDEFPALPNVEKSLAIPIMQGRLKKLIKQTMFSVSADESRSVFTGGLFEMNGNKLTVVSTDGFRISVRQLENEAQDSNCRHIIPATTLNEIHKLLSSSESEKALLYSSPNHILFDLGKCIVVSRLLNGEFINYEGAFNTNSVTSILINRQRFLTGIERAALIALEQQRVPIKLQINFQKLFISAIAEIGTCNEEVDIDEIIGDMGLQIGMNPKYLMDALNAIEDEVVKVDFGSPVQPAIIRPVSGEMMYQYLVLPVRSH